MRRLLLFSSTFPYGDLETYLETELPFLARKFDSVTIQPTRADTKVSRPVPSNVKVAKPLWHAGETKMVFFIRAITRLGTWKLFLDEALKQFQNPVTLLKIFHWSCYRQALESSDAVRESICCADKTIAYSYWGGITALAIPKLAIEGIPCCVRYHRVDLYKHAQRGSGYMGMSTAHFPWREEIVRSSSLSALISSHGEEYFLSHWGECVKEHAKIGVFRLGVFHRGENPAKSNAGKNELVIVSCSYIRPVKQVHLIARLVKELARDRCVTWHHFGSGTSKLLDKELASTGGAQLTVELHGFVANAEIVSFYRDHHVDLFFNLSLSEGIPVSIMEAISFGIPAVATNVDGNGEVVVTGMSGLLVDFREAEESVQLATRIGREFELLGAINRSTPNVYWDEYFNANKNFAAFASELANLR